MSAEYKSLRDMISAGDELTDDQKRNMYILFGHRARKETKAILDRKLDVPLSCWNSYGIYDRVHVYPDGRVDYCAGQDYSAEVPYVRNLIIGKG